MAGCNCCLDLGSRRGSIMRRACSARRRLDGLCLGMCEGVEAKLGASAMAGALGAKRRPCWKPMTALAGSAEGICDAPACAMRVLEETSAIGGAAARRKSVEAVITLRTDVRCVAAALGDAWWAWCDGRP